MSPLPVTASGLISNMVASRSRKARYAPRKIRLAWAIWPGARPSLKASSLAWKATKPTAGSIVIRTSASGRYSASSSISMPPSAEAMIITCSVLRSSTMPKYSSRVTSVAAST